ncbi:hypothetical protein [Agaribacterium haliotis]|uniref:hypothetical protein n=1 Tax=Agaribacterium haliotis TaxID=2013869 RepID=UPI000BB52C83|nr:hypothetical protein [Agaribacterium haliotis]
MNTDERSLNVAFILETLPEQERTKIRDWMASQFNDLNSAAIVSNVYYQYLAYARNQNDAAKAVLEKVRDITGKEINTIALEQFH